MITNLYNLYYSKQHDWICFFDTYAYIGTSGFKLTGIRRIDDIRLFGYKPGDTIEQGAELLNIQYNEYVIAVQAPVSGILLETNDIIGRGSWDVITREPEAEGWLFKIDPVEKNTTHLLHHTLYATRFAGGLINQPRTQV
jgi:glycine cleavage system H protein